MVQRRKYEEDTWKRGLLEEYSQGFPEVVGGFLKNLF
jgi:hypothetical protein